MAKWSWGVFSKLLQLHNLVRLSIGLSTLAFFLNFGSFNYDHIPLDEIEANLYKHVNPNLKLDPNKPACDYGFIHEPDGPMLEIPTSYDEFLPTGIANGSFLPSHCNPQLSVALLVTYRKRQKQLDIFLPYIHNYLRKQNIHYKIFLIEQQDDAPWNKGALYNIGARLAMDERFPCLVLHDVDLLPRDPRNLYACLQQPRHLSASVDRLRHVLPYWFPERVSRYAMLPHVKQAAVNPRRAALLRQSLPDQRHDGLNSVKHIAMEVKKYRLYTLIGVRL
ncbi:hypothetical protein JYU34_013174 [Plutella xylostella]|uniref:Galactosyltransferase N-terminal domain-containing protein n=1 Tax=Plutella xylostella TaxID=51655 RepID=A0ABQ7QD49_PLUXY|nr:hypothetical protein JYU34_013174 [Plutella xylostella]